MSRQETLNQVVVDIRRSIPELAGVMIASIDGLPIAHDLSDADADNIAAMGATALGLGQRVSERTALGGMIETVIRGSNGYFVVYSAGDQALLILFGSASSNLGLMRVEAAAATSRIAGGIR